MKSKLTTVFVVFCELGLIISLISILIFLLTGGFKYTPYNFLDGNFTVSTLWRPVVFLCIFSLILYFFNKKGSVQVKVFTRPINYIILSLLFFLVFTLPVVLDGYFNLNIALGHDHAAKLQISYRLFSGDPRTTIFEYTKNPVFNYFGNHFSPILIILASILILVKHLWFVLFIQVLIYALGAVAVYLIAKKVLENDFFAIILGILYLVNPLASQSFFYGFRFELFMITFLLFAFYFILKEKYILFIIFYILAGSCKEMVTMTLSPLGIYILFKAREKRYKLLGLAVFVVSILYSYSLIKFFMPAIVGGKVSSLAKYPSLGSVIANPSLLWQSIITPAKRRVFLQLFMMAGLLPFFSKITLLGLVGGTGLILAEGDTFVLKHTWHSIHLYQFLVIGAIFGLRNIRNFLQGKDANLRIGLYSSIIFLAGVTSLNGFNEWILTPFFEKKLYSARIPPIYKRLQKAKEFISIDDTVFTLRDISLDLPQYKVKCFPASRFLDYEEIKKNIDFIIDNPNRSVRRMPFEDFHFDNILNKGDLILLYYTDEISLWGRYDQFKRIIGDKYNFMEQPNLEKWDIRLNNANFPTQLTDESLKFDLEFDGGSDEDEYLSLERDIEVDIKRYPLLELELASPLSHPSIQIIELIVLLDLDEDVKWDKQIKRHRFDYTRRILQWNIYEELSEKEKELPAVSAVRIHILLHKLWGADCTEDKSGNYPFSLKQIGFFGVERRSDNEL